tara:strand:- start:5 stop:898 length:894 start_codon:yes stop_codon:yes gene_type:complete
MKKLILFCITVSFLISDIKENLNKYHKDLLSLFENQNNDVYDKEFAVNHLYNNNLNEEFYNKLYNYNLTLSSALNSPDFFLKVEKPSIDKYKLDSRYFTKIQKELKKKDKSRLINTFINEEKEENFEDLVAPALSKYLNNNLIFSFNSGLASSKPVFGNITKFSSNGKIIEFYIYHPDLVKIFNFTNVLAFSLNKIEFNKGWNRNLTFDSFNIHIINYFFDIPLRFDTSIGISNNVRYDLGFLFKSSIQYNLEFEPVDLIFDFSYNKYIDIDDNNQLNFDLLNFILFNIKISKEFSI